jgi:hypothetical protein
LSSIINSGFSQPGSSYKPGSSYISNVLGNAKKQVNANKAQTEVTRLADSFRKGDRTPANFTECPGSGDLEKYHEWQARQAKSSANRLLNPNNHDLDCPLGFMADLRKKVEAAKTGVSRTANTEEQMIQSATKYIINTSNPHSELNVASSEYLPVKSGINSKGTVLVNNGYEIEQPIKARNIKISENSRVNTVSAKKNLVLSDGSVAQKVKISVKNTNIELNDNSKIGKVSSNKNLTIQGEGVIGEIRTSGKKVFIEDLVQLKSTHLFNNALSGKIIFERRGIFPFRKPSGTVIVKRNPQAMTPGINPSMIKNGKMIFEDELPSIKKGLGSKLKKLIKCGK